MAAESRFGQHALERVPQGRKKQMMNYEITPEDVKIIADRGDPFELVDVREPWEHQTARIEGATLIPMGDVPSRAHQELDPEAHIIVYCHHGVRSMNVTAWLRQQGFEKTQSMAGGIDAWSRRVDGKVPVY
jgi:rhodanese-related sulfurtransferase